MSQCRVETVIWMSFSLTKFKPFHPPFLILGTCTPVRVMDDANFGLSPIGLIFSAKVSHYIQCTIIILNYSNSTCFVLCGAVFKVTLSRFICQTMTFSYGYRTLPKHSFIFQKYAKHAAHLEKCATVRIMRHTQKYAPHSEKCSTLGKVRHIWKYAPHLEMCATLGKMRHTRKYAAHLEKCAKLGKVHHTWKYAPHLEKCSTIGNMWHTWKYVAHLEKCGTLRNRVRPLLSGHLRDFKKWPLNRGTKKLERKDRKHDFIICF